MTTMSRSAALLAQAVGLAPDLASWRAGQGGTPSRLAKMLMDLAERDGAHCEFKLSVAEYVHLRDESPDARWYRAVYRMGDGSVLAVHDQGGDCAQSEKYVLRHPGGHFAGVWDGEDSESLMRSFAGAFQRLPAPESDEEAHALAESVRGGGINRASDYPLSDIYGVLHQAEDGSALLATKNGVLRVPGNAPEAQRMLDHAFTCMDRMSQTLGIPKDEIMADIHPSVRVFQEAIGRFEEGRSFAPAKTLGYEL